MRSLLALAVAILVTGCGSAPYAAFRPGASSAALTTTATPAAWSHGRPAPVRLPPACRRADGPYSGTASHSGAGGHLFVTISIHSRHRCKLAGPVGVRMLDRRGRPMSFRFTGRPWGPFHDQPMLAGPHHAAEVLLSEQTCDVPGTPRSSRTAVVTLPGLAHLHVAAVLPSCPQSPGNQPAQHSGIGDSTADAYALPIGSPFVHGGDGTWGRADVDGDGRPDVVLLTGQGHLEIRLATGRTLTSTLPRWGRLQAFTDVNGDGAAEILAGYTAIGCCGGYDLLDSFPRVMTLEGGALRRVRIPLTWDVGHGDLYAGVVCDGDHITEVSSETAYAAPFHRVRRVTWRVTGVHAVRVSATTDRETGDPVTLTATHCPGMNARGWAE